MNQTKTGRDWLRQATEEMRHDDPPERWIDQQNDFFGSNDWFVLHTIGVAIGGVLVVLLTVAIVLDCAM